jgi:hypothetical protein
MWLIIFISIPIARLTTTLINWVYERDICENCLCYWIAFAIGLVESGDIYLALGYAGLTWVFNRVLNYFITEL